MLPLEMSGLRVLLERLFGAKLWHLGLVLAVAFGAFNVHAGLCEDALSRRLLAPTRFVDPQSFDRMTESDLKAALLVYGDIKSKLAVDLTDAGDRIIQARANVKASPERAPYHVIVQKEKEAGVHDAVAKYNEIQQSIKNVNQYVKALSRSLERRQKSLPTPGVPSKVLNVALSVSGKDAQQVIGEILRGLEKSHIKKSDTVWRYFMGAKQDVVRAYGIDKFGSDFGSGTAWDEFGLEGLLKSRGLNVDDGFYAVPYGEAVGQSFDQHGPKDPFVMIEDFTKGDRALVIYDLNQLEDLETDFFLFKNPAKKRDAVLAIFRPVRGH